MITREKVFVKIENIPRAVLEGWWYSGKKIRQIWAEWAVCADDCYL